MAAVDSQPTGTFSDPAETLKDLDPNEVKKWTTKEVIENFLTPIGLQQLAELFNKHSITGAVLLSLDKKDLKDMKIFHVGERLYIDHCLEALRRQAKKLERETSLWKGVYPTGSIAYYESFWECFKYKCCPCCMPLTHLKVTAQGFTRRDNPPACNCACQGMTNDFEDFRLLKDIDWADRRSCICLHRREMVMKFDASNKAESGGSRVKEQIIRHPDMTEDLVRKIKNAWTEARLVAD
eukprot:m.18292 g.18292  ORF g.18292 m.18292 type:complete len:238 (+) comp6273_c0_seq1:177-890(+)